MSVGVRDYLEKLGHKVGYDKKSGDVLVGNGYNMKSIGNEGFTLGNDGRYYAESENDILKALKKNNIDYTVGFSPVRNSLGKENTVGYNYNTGQISINGRDYNIDGKNLLRVGDEIYGSDSFLKDVQEEKFENKYDAQEKRIIDLLLKEEYEGYNPEDDESYMMAYDSFMKSAKADMGKRGMTSDSLAAYYASQGAEKLMPEYAKLHYEKYRDRREDLKDAVSTLIDMDESRRAEYKQNRDDRMNALEYQNKRDNTNFERENNIKDNALKKSELLGFVTKEDGELLNIPEGTKTYEAKENDENRDFEKQMAFEKYENEKKIEELKSKNRREEAELEYYRDIEIRKIQNDLDISKAEATAYYKAIYK